MGSTDGADGCGIGVDCSVGTIVWVRRRNGSWWPGRILGPDELSVSHLMSPRSGTPVKLLGREDASVDWYNLDKSKRVKAFRCGEFDACIERAEASQGTPIKKREKYARREDAILHALELEKKQQELGSSSNILSNKTTGSHKNEPANLYSPESYIRHDEYVNIRSLSAHKQHNFLIETDFSHEVENVNDSSYADKGRSNKQFRWEDDNPEAIPRMRGLQDFGLRTAQPKRKHSQSVNWEDSGKPLAKHMQLYSSSGYMLEDADHASSSKNPVAVKRKRSQSGMVEESLFKKRDRRRPLLQVLQSSAKLAPHLFECGYDGSGISMSGEKDHMQSISRAKRSSCVYFPADSDGPPRHGGSDSGHLSVLENQFGARNDFDNPILDVEGYISSGLIEAKVSDSLEADYLEPNMGEEASMLTDTTHVLVPGSKDYEPPEFQIPEKFRRLNGYEIPHSGITPQLHEQITDASAEVGVSKWHMKGKRNTRNIGKRPMDAGDRKIYSSFAENCNGSMDEMTCENKGNNLNIEKARLSSQKALSWGIIPKKESFYASAEGDLIDKDLAHNQLTISGEWRNPLSLQSKDDGRSHSSLNDSDNSHELAPSVWEADVPSNLAHSAFWEDPVERYQPVYDSHIDNEMETLLVDVDLKVEASYQGEHVPLVSLMSRLNGKAIIGHPVQIEMLENGSTSHLVSKYNVGMDESAAPPPVWCTARRTAMQRVPRSNPLSAALEDEDADMLQYSEHGSKPPLNRKAYSGYLSHQASLTKNSASHARHSRSRKFQKKNSKKLSLSSQKTRTLASLATNDKLGSGSRVKLAGSNDILEGLIQPEGSIPLVTCVPVKVVFSRLLEAVGRPSSAVGHRIRMNSPTVQAPS